MTAPVSSAPDFPRPDAPTQPLRCLQGRACPDEVLDKAKSAPKLTREAIANLASVLDPCVLEPMTPALSQALSQFSLRHEVAEADLGRTIAALRFLIREAAASDLPTEAFAEDLARVCPEPAPLVAAVVGRYEDLKQKVRQQFYLAALRDHGAILEDVAWRMDLVATTSQAPRLLLPVAMLTLRYRDGEADKRLTLQIPGDVLRKLHSVTELMLK